MAKKSIITTAGETISGAAGSAASAATDMAGGAALVATGAARTVIIRGEVHLEDGAVVRIAFSGGRDAQKIENETNDHPMIEDAGRTAEVRRQLEEYFAGRR